MSFSKTPTDWVTGISQDGTNLTIPITELEGLATTDITGDEADIRKIFLALNAMMLSAYYSQDVADRPAKMRMDINPVPTVDGSLLKIYTNRFDVAVTGTEMSDE